MAIPFIDLGAQRRRLGDRIDNAVMQVINSGQYINGPAVTELESQLAEFCGARFCLGCSSGTDALALLLMAWRLKPGDAVFVPAFTFVATAEVVVWLGATPVFVDVLEDSFNMDPASLEKAIDSCAALGLKPRLVMPVDLFGQPADYAAILDIAKANGLRVLCDAAQSFGASWQGKRIGSIGDATATSFFPAKPLGCYGDAGAVFTNDEELFEVLKSLRIHGFGEIPYEHPHIGMNARIDTVQAAILIEKLAIFADEIEVRQVVAQRYSDALNDIAEVPAPHQGNVSAWAQYTLKVSDRDRLRHACKEAGVPTAVYYPIPLSQQSAYQRFPSAPGGTPVSERLSECVVSLPMHPYLDPESQCKVIEACLQQGEA